MTRAAECDPRVATSVARAFATSANAAGRQAILARALRGQEIVVPLTRDDGEITYTAGEFIRAAQDILERAT